MKKGGNMKKPFLFIAFILILVFFVSQVSAMDYTKDGTEYKDVMFKIFVTDGVNNDDKINKWAEKNKFLIIDIRWNGSLLVIYTEKKPNTHLRWE